MLTFKRGLLCKGRAAVGTGELSQAGVDDGMRPEVGGATEGLGAGRAGVFARLRTGVGRGLAVIPLGVLAQT